MSQTGNVPPSEIHVVAAVIERDGRILICQRKRESKHALKWEFPGGKVEPGESPAAALVRELREELAIDAVVGDELAGYAVSYPSSPLIHLRFYRVVSFSGELQNMEFEQIVWENRSALKAYDFLEGDLAFLRLLEDPPV